jgi:hypothetical protein
MDFLDPKKRRAYHIRLIVGYVLVAIVIGLATVILVYGANGYGINTKTGQIVQNGLLFADSKPGGARIYLNDVDQNAATAARLVLPAGNYKLTLKKSGYRDWSRHFTLSEQSVARYVYPFLFPVDPKSTNLKTYDSLPAFTTQSPNLKWLLIQNNSTSTKVPVFDEYDTTTLDQTTPSVTSLALPEGLLTSYSATSKLTEIEWSSDNIHLLLRHDYDGGSEFVIVDRSHPDQSFNVNQLFNIAPAQVNMRDKKSNQLYILSAIGDLQLGDVTTKTVSNPILKQVLAYKPYSTNLITYVTAASEPAGTVVARIWNSGQTYKLYEFSAGNTYLIDAAQFQGHFYYVAGSDTSNRINIYKDPLNGLKDPSINKALPTLALHNLGATKLKFSDNTRFIGTENLQSFAVYDLETQNAYQYQLSDSLADNMDWMDGHRWLGVSNGNVLVMDYDGINKQIITPTLLVRTAYFSGDYNQMIVISSADNGSGVVLRDLDMRAGTDLPKK